jgi:hypothetical protein
MTFKSETIKSEIYLKISENSDDKNFMKITPLKNSNNFPLEFGEDRFCTLPERYLDYAEQIKNLEVRSDDVWLISFPKSGTTWAQELTWMLVNNFSFGKALDVSIIHRFPYLE